MYYNLSMTKQIKTAQFFYSTDVAVEMSMLPIGTTHAVIRQKSTQTSKVASLCTPSSTLDTICTIEMAELVMSGHKFDVPILPGEGQWCLAPDELLIMIGENGWGGEEGDQVYHLAMLGISKPFDLAKNRSDVRLVRVCNNSRMVFDLDGNSIPTAKYCDYIEGGIHNEAYHLKKVLNRLRNDSRIRFVNRNSSTTDQGKIRDIPYYNADVEKNQYISFVYMPTLEDETMLWSKQQSYGLQYPSTARVRAMEELDILYIEEFRKNSKD
jgi:hypothetical protein